MKEIKDKSFSLDNPFGYEHIRYELTDSDSNEVTKQIELQILEGSIAYINEKTQVVLFNKYTNQDISFEVLPSNYFYNNEFDELLEKSETYEEPVLIKEEPRSVIRIPISEHDIDCFREMIIEGTTTEWVFDSSTGEQIYVQFMNEETFNKE